MSRRKTIVIAIIAIFLIGILLYFVPLSSKSKILPKEDAKPVAVAEVTRQDLIRGITLSAELRPYQEIDLHAKVAGYLKFITVDIGDQVKKGQVIAKIDTDELTADLAHATAAYHDAKLDYDRTEAVIKKQPGLLAQQEVDDVHAKFEMAKANMEHAKTFMDYSTIIVPFDGVVTKRYADPGAFIQASVSSGTQTLPIVHIAENKRLRLDFPIPEADVPFVRVGTPVAITIKATGQTISTVVARTANKVDSSTRTMETEVDINNADLRLTPGMYAVVNVNLEGKTGVLTLPIQAVSISDQPNVWVVNSKKEIEERPVTIGMQTPDKVEILDGLNEGDQVVFGSRDNVSIGMKVDPKPVGGRL